MQTTSRRSIEIVLALVATAALALGGAALAKTPLERFQPIQGASYALVKAHIGVPDKERLEDGIVLATWYWSMPGDASATVNNYNCQMYLSVGADGTVTKLEVEGKACGYFAGVHHRGLKRIAAARAAAP